MINSIKRVFAELCNHPLTHYKKEYVITREILERYIQEGKMNCKLKINNYLFFIQREIIAQRESNL